MNKFQFIRQRTNQFENVQAGSTAIVQLPIGPTYLGLDIAFKGLTVADMREIRVKVNNEVRHRYSGTERNVINVYDGYLDAATTGLLKLPFTRRQLKTLSQEVTTALVTGVGGEGGAIANLTVEIDLAAGTTPAFELHADISDPIESGPGAMLSLYRDTVEANFVGEKAIANLVTRGDGKRVMVNRHFLFMPSGVEAEAVLERVRVRRNQFDIYDHVPITAAIEQAENQRQGNDGVFVIDPTVRGYGGNGYDVFDATDYRILMDTLAAVSSVTVLSEFIGNLR